VGYEISPEENYNHRKNAGCDDSPLGDE